MSRDRRSHPLLDWRCVVFAAALVGLLFIALPAGAAEVVFQTCAFGSITVFFVNVLRRRGNRLPWVLIGLGFACFAVGDLLFALYVYAFDIDPFPSPADLFYVAGYPLLVAGLTVLVHRSRPDGDRIALLDAGIILVPATVVAWVYLIGPNAAETSVGLFDRAVSAAYPTGDLLFLAVLVRFVTAPVGTRRASHPSLTLLLIAFGSMLVADIWFATAELYGGYASGGWIDAIFLFQYLTLAAASAYPSMARLGDPVPRADPSLGSRRLAMLAFAALVTPSILILQWLAHNDLAVPLIFGATALSFLLVVARMSSIVDALETSRAQLRHDATHDGLTGLCNRSLFTEEIDEVVRRGQGGALLFVDLDRFKQINDRFGHQVGDEVLIEVASRMTAAVRGNDRVARLAGDEFAVLLPDVSSTTAYIVAERLLHQLRFVVPDADGGPGANVSASIGLVMWNRGDAARTARQLLNDADRAMYVAKAGKGDQLATEHALSGI